VAEHAFRTTDKSVLVCCSLNIAVLAHCFHSCLSRTCYKPSENVDLQLKGSDSVMHKWMKKLRDPEMEESPRKPGYNVTVTPGVAMFPRSVLYNSLKQFADNLLHDCVL
jgi:hypothetical protein